MLKVGLCGKIAAGKSTVEKILREYGFFVVDLDEISHNLLLNNDEVKKEVLSEFNTLNRFEIARIVFDNKNKRKKLESIIHPKLREYVVNLFNEKKDESYIFVSGALLFEAGFDVFFDKIIFVDSKEKIRLERLQKRNNLSELQAKKRIDSQGHDYKNKVDFVIENNGSIEELKTRADEVIKQLSN